MAFRSILFGLLMAWMTILFKGGYIVAIMSDQLPQWSRWAWQPALFIAAMLVAMSAWTLIERWSTAGWEKSRRLSSFSAGELARGYDKVQH